MKINIKHFALVLGIGVFAAGCSGSEETAKSEADRAPDGFRGVDKEEIVIPATDTPPAATVETPDQLRTAQPSGQQKPAPADGADQRVPAGMQEAPKSGIMMWSVQIGAFRAEEGADKLFSEARTKFSHPVYKDFDAVSGLYKVTVGSFQTREQASLFKEEVISRGYQGAFTVEALR